MSDTFTIAHLSDLHLGPLPPFGVRHWNLKRALGFANWHRKRRAAHLPAVAAALVADIQRLAPDHIAVTGDLINIGLPAEYEAALAWLEALGPTDRVSVVPGNHDIYVRLLRDAGVARWQGYMADDAATADGDSSFPYVRRRGRVALIGLNSAVPTRPLVASGQLGEIQLTSLARILDELGREGLARVVMIHHPPLPGQASPRKALRDADALAGVLRRHGAELVLHGHNHRREVHRAMGPGADVPVVGVPSASLGAAHEGETLARYHLFGVMLGAGPPRVSMISRGLMQPGGPVVEIERLDLDSEAFGTDAAVSQAGTT